MQYGFGVGAVGTAILGIVLLGESANGGDRPKKGYKPYGLRGGR